MGVCAPHTTPGCTAGTFLIIIWVGHQGSELVLIARVDTVKPLLPYIDKATHFLADL